MPLQPAGRLTVTFWVAGPTVTIVILANSWVSLENGATRSRFGVLPSPPGSQSHGKWTYRRNRSRSSSAARRAGTCPPRSVHHGRPYPPGCTARPADWPSPCRPGCHSARKTSSRSLRRALSRDGGSGRSRRCWRPRRPWRPLPYRLFHRSGRKSIADSESYAPYMVSPTSGSTSCGYNTGNTSAQTPIRLQVMVKQRFATSTHKRPSQVSNNHLQQQGFSSVLCNADAERVEMVWRFAKV